MKICSEADYLQAHLTIIEGKSLARGTAIQNALNRLASRLKKRIPGYNGPQAWQSSHPNRRS
ncbi:MAG TPA: hypothetical protein VL128_13750 [Candidatus Eisenbacteria bacterium]|nr:hypothetical protein [Candidatus Eisenbacteria bacterium]